MLLKEFATACQHSHHELLSLPTTKVRIFIERAKKIPLNNVNGSQKKAYDKKCANYNTFKFVSSQSNFHCCSTKHKANFIRTWLSLHLQALRDRFFVVLATPLPPKVIDAYSLRLVVVATPLLFMGIAGLPT